MSLPTTYVIQNTKRTRVGVDRNVAHTEGLKPISSAHSMNARKSVHAQKPKSCQVFAHKSSKVGGRGKRMEDRKDRGQEADGKKGSPTK